MSTAGDVAGEKLRSVTLGHGECPHCFNGEAAYRVNKNGGVYVVCPPERDGGCNTQAFFRSGRGGELAAGRIKRWYPGMKERWQQRNGAAAAAPASSAEPTTSAEPTKDQPRPNLLRRIWDADLTT